MTDEMLHRLRPGAIHLVLGTRPELVKLAVVAQRLGDRAAVVHTGQHFSELMADGIARDLGFPSPTHQLRIGGRHRGDQIGQAVSALTNLLLEHRPAAVVVQGDTNSVVAGALAANATGVPLVHLEAGLRSRDRAMPEEHNRIVADHLADLCLAPTSTNIANLAAEGIVGDRVVETGNTVVDAVQALLPDVAARQAHRAALGLEGEFVLATLHRPENVDDPARLEAIVAAIRTIEALVVLPVHPRTQPLIDRLRLPENLRLTAPFEYRRFLAVMASASVLLSDSGGVQEEASVVKRPVVVLRRSTERPEILGTFADLTPDPAAAAALVNTWLSDPRRRDRLHDVPSPYGDGNAAARSVLAILRHVM